MLSPDSALILWQIIAYTQLLGSIYTTTRLYKHSLSFKIKTVWCFVILFILWCAPYLGPLVKLDNGLNLDPYERQDQAQIYG